MLYTHTFLIFFALLCMVVLIEALREGQGKTTPFSHYIFWTFSGLMIAFTLLRPFGIARDDSGYLEIYSHICPIFECGQWIQSSRDWGWYVLVGIMKSIWPRPRVMLLLAAIALLVKLLAIFSLVKKPLPVLLLFSAAYYQVQDLTAFRVSFSIAVLMLAVWLLVRYRNMAGGIAIVLSGFFHKQAFVAPLVLTGYVVKSRFWLLLILCLSPICLLLLSFYPHLESLGLKSDFGGFLPSGLLSNGLADYVVRKESGVYVGSRLAPIVFYPLIAFSLWMCWLNRPLEGRLKILIMGCLISASLLLWGFASLPEPQVRFFEFFMMPAVLLMGLRPLNLLQTCGLVMVATMFVIKYNVLVQLIAPL